MDPDHLKKKIARQAAALWGGRLPEPEDKGYIPLDESGPPGWSLIYQTLHALEEMGEPLWMWAVVLVFFLPMAAVDLVHFPLRFVMYPLALLAWWVEKSLAAWLGLRYFCGVCHKSTDVPWVYCPNGRCRRRVQTRLRPRFNSLFLRTCPACGRGRWWLLGQRFLWRPKPLVCRHTETVSGCYRPLRLSALIGRYPVKHLAVMGTTVRAKHAVMG